MPSRGSYQIARQDERKAAQRDQSYRSCVATLLIFFMLCMIILIACIPWKKYGTSRYNKEEEKNTITASHHGNKPVTDDRGQELDWISSITQKTTTDLNKQVVTEHYVSQKNTHQSFERYYHNSTTIREHLEEHTSVTTDPQEQNKTTVEKVETTKQPELRYNDTNGTTSFNYYEISVSTRPEETTTMSTVSMSDVEKNNSFTTETNDETSEYSTTIMKSTHVSNSALFNESTSENIYTTTEKVHNTETTNSSEVFTTTVNTVNNTEINKFTTQSDITNSSEVFTTTDSTLNNTEINRFTTQSDITNSSELFNTTDSTVNNTEINKFTTQSDITNSSEVFTTTDSTLNNTEINRFTTQSDITNSSELFNTTDSTVNNTKINEFTTQSDITNSSEPFTTTDSTVNNTEINRFTTQSDITNSSEVFTTMDSTVNNTEINRFTTQSDITNSSEPFTTTDSTVNNTEINEFTKESSTTYEPTFTPTFTDHFTNATVTEIENTSTEETVISIDKERNYRSSSETTTESNTITRSIPDENITICNSGHCKHVAAKMLSYMNHSADPCEDFYEYACGDMVADSQILELNLADKAYRRIAKQMQNNNNDAASLFNKYYDSCMQYENTISIKERIEWVKKAINKIGKFYTIRDKFDSHENFTTMYAKLLSSYSPLLFDVVPDLDDYDPKLYGISLRPILHKNLFDSENMDESCYANENKIQKQFIDLEGTYEDYIECKQNNTRFMNSVRDALMVLGIFNDTNEIKENVLITASHIDKEIVQAFFLRFPSQAKIRKAFSWRFYIRVTIEQLNKITTLIDWSHLISLLMKKDVNHDTQIQVYFYNEFVNGLKQLQNFMKKRPKDFNNAILGLYAHKLYQDLVVSKHEDRKQYCLRVSTNLLGPEASYLYMSSLSNKEIANMNHVVKKVFDELKETLKTEIQGKTWLKYADRVTLIAKINSLSLSVPEMSYFKYEKNNELDLSDNYINNTLILMERYRSSIYSVILSSINPGTPEQIWTQYATPFQTKGVAVYGLNLVIIPFGAIDYGNMFIKNDEILPNYLTWITILIARQISHHFDANGMFYWNQTRHNKHVLTHNYNNYDLENSYYSHYIQCHNNIIYEYEKNMILPLTSQTVSFKIEEHTLNVRLSEIMGLRLAYDTLERLEWLSKNRLPWIELNVKQLFYLTYAQMYCTKSLLTTSYVSLHENEELPSRIRVFVSASSNILLGQLWHCPKGSQTAPSERCDVFPHLETEPRYLPE